MTTRLATAIAVVLLLASCGKDSNTDLACSTLGEIATDFGDGVATMGDMPERMGELVKDARGSDEMHPLAQRALDEARAGDEDALAASVRAMNDVCN